MKYVLLCLAPLALVACETVALPMQAPSEPAPVIVETDEAEKTEEAVEETAEETKEETAEEALDVTTSEDASADEEETNVEDTSENTRFAETFIDISPSQLVQSLVSKDLLNEDVALMGLVNGARTYCGLDWQPSFVTFINMANRQGLNITKVADDHGYYMGAGRTALENAEYVCTDQDLIELRAIDPY